MKKEIITTLIKEKLFFKKNKFFVNLPEHHYKNNGDQFFYYNERWSKPSKLLKDFDYLEDLYEQNLKSVSKKLNKYHDKKYPISYWRLIIGKWLYRFICVVYERHNSIIDIDRNYKNLKFYKLKYNFHNFIPCGIEDFGRFHTTHAWNEYVYSEIINQCEIRSIEVISSKKILNFSDSKEIYKRLTIKKESMKKKIYLAFINFLSTFNVNINYLIFDTYLSFIDEIKLNYKVNKRFTLLTTVNLDKLLINTLKKKKLSKLRKFSSKTKNKNFKNFISEFILINLPIGYLEGFDAIKSALKNLKLPVSPKIIFTTRGVNRSTLIDHYIGSKLLENTKLIIGQHGGNYGQHKGHWGSKHEMKISNKFLSWENKKTKSQIPFGYIKGIQETKYDKNNKMILFETRNRSMFSGEFKIDVGSVSSVTYMKKICSFLKKIQSTKLLESLRIKNRESNFGWEEKKKFLKANNNIKFINPKLKMTDLLNKSKLTIYSFPSTGHLECMMVNKPMLMFYFNDLKLLRRETELYFKEFIKLGILYTEPNALYKKLIEIYDDPGKWWYSKNIQKCINSYTKRFCKRNENIIKNLTNQITKNN